MSKISIAIATAAVALLGLSPIANAAGVYIQQLQPKGGAGAAGIEQSGPRGGVLMTQMPAGARLRPPPAAAPPVRFVPVQFLQQVLAATAETAEAALVPYLAGKRPGLPLITAGVNAAFNTPTADSSVPTVGTGLLN